MAENAGWDKEILAIELGHLMTIEGADFDVSITSFEVAEIDLILQVDKTADEQEEDIPAFGPTMPAISQPGDCWILAY